MTMLSTVIGATVLVALCLVGIWALFRNAFNPNDKDHTDVE